jgi:tetratricopeptide (TPR) repeat protein
MHAAIFLFVSGIFALRMDGQAQSVKQIRVPWSVLEEKQIYTLGVCGHSTEDVQPGRPSKVRLDLLIGTTGAVKDIRVLSGRKILADSCAASLWNFYFEPTIVDGHPVEVWATWETDLEMGRKLPLAVDPAEEVRRKPGDFRAHFNRAYQLLQKKDLEGAAHEFEEVLRLRPTHYQAVLLLASIQSQKRDWDGALDRVNQAVAMRSDIPAGYGLRAGIFETMKRYDEALADLRTELKLSPPDTAPYWHLGPAFYRILDHGEATRQFRELLDSGDHAFEEHKSLASSLRWDGKGFLDGAIAEYEEALRLKPADSECLKELHETKAERSKKAALATGWQHWLNKHPADRTTRAKLALWFHAIEDWESAIHEYDELVQQQPKNASLHGMLAYVLERGGRLEQALAEYQRASELEPASDAAIDYKYLARKLEAKP